MSDIIITDPAQWRAGDKVTIEGTLSADLNGALRLGKNVLLVRSRTTDSLSATLRDDTITVTVRRPAPSLPDQPGDVFYATVNGCPNLLVAPSAALYLLHRASPLQRQVLRRNRH